MGGQGTDGIVKTTSRNEITKSTLCEGPNIIRKNSDSELEEGKQKQYVYQTIDLFEKSNIIEKVSLRDCTIYI